MALWEACLRGVQLLNHLWTGQLCLQLCLLSRFPEHGHCTYNAVCLKVPAALLPGQRIGRIGHILALTGAISWQGFPASLDNISDSARLARSVSRSIISRPPFCTRVPPFQGHPLCCCQVSFLQLAGEAFNDFTIIVLLVAGVVSIGLEAALGKPGDNGWIEGAAILAAVAVVVLVTAVNNYQKEKQFRELSALADASEVRVLV